MDIKKMSDTQIMLTLTKQDLTDRNLNISDIASNSMKAQKLFKDIMSTAITEYGFTTDESPIMIEAIPASDGITIIISKVKEDMNDNISLIPGSLDGRKFLNSPVTLRTSNSESIEISTNVTYMFESLKDVTNVSYRLAKIYNGENILYKYNNNYYLVMDSDNETTVMFSDLELILAEYGVRYDMPSKELAHALFLEHGEILIKENAIKILSNL